MIQNTKKVGNISEAKILNAFLELGASVLVPWGDNCRYDFVVDISSKLLKIQCKTGRLVKGAIMFPTRSLTTLNGKRIRVTYQGQIDYFAVYSPDTKQVYCVDVNECGIDQFSLRLDLPKNNQSDKVHLAEKYEIHEIFQSLV